ncbi:hypothetical protein EH221_00255 [bacterium]|nr:MAG: hypothetical protein EH221_00255 [bacterium]
MKKQDLLMTAKQIQPPSLPSTQEFTEKKVAMASDVIRILRKRPDIEKLLVSDNLDMMDDNVRNMSRFMESVFCQYNPEVLVETCLWVFRAYRNHGFQLTFWPAHLDIWIEVLKASLSDTSLSEIMPFYQWIQVNIPTFVTMTDTSMSEIPSLRVK